MEITTIHQKALEVLDYYIFGNIWNHHTIDDRNWDITFVGNNFLVRDLNTNKAYPFKVTIEALQGYDWDEEIANQEWEDVDVVE